MQSLASADDDNNWRDAFVDLEIDEDELEKQYVSTMQGQRFNIARIQESHCFDSNMQGSLDPRYAVIVGEDSVRSPTVWTTTCKNQWNDHYDISKGISGAPSWMSPRHLQKTRTKEK